ncbi:50S ribosomal protein L6 [Blattabacterium sp. (Blaberus giganteus)]|uniref:50S ribosomal protein L6 n=1 Tax=Blattabacterium sp. (Blaberus giganteus) TaxID=1186051 RepID=UPI00025F6F7E|nr:50S ribosomal protein L6 [Blattabacterium sp. (Blaberus giganteus)]AFJ90813.1 50S ribosomal protein L6 [Blattabacterium sp. (Blaberus giganteus)]
MSRIGKKPIFIPKDVSIKIFNEEILVEGSLGSLSQKNFKEFQLNLNNNQLLIIRNKEDKKSKSLHGLYHVLIKNMIIGVTKGFQKKLELVGVGYRASFYNGEILDLNLGFSHNIMMQLPKEVKIEIQSEKGKNTILILKSNNKQLLGIIAAKIRSFRAPEPYKGKGIRYFGEEVRRKAGKSA